MPDCEFPPRVDLLFIGAPKCGTTWLTRQLAGHPLVAMPLDELHYYSRQYARGPGWYESQFPAKPGATMRAENSNSYLTEAADALPRIAAEQPEAKILCVLRNPIDRAYSSYGMQIDRGRASQDIAKYLDPNRSPRPHVLTNGLYARLLKPWYDIFPSDQIKVMRFERIARDPAGLIEDVCAFMGLDPAQIPTDAAAPANARKTQGLPGPLKRALWWARPILNSSSGQKIVSGRIGRSITRGLSRPKRYPALTQSLRARLGEYYARDLESLEQLTGATYMDWLDSGD